MNEPLHRFNTIGRHEAQAAYEATLKGPLSGYLGGERHGGAHVERLERTWREMFDVKHAVSCNSATSGLLMACMAAGVGPGVVVRTTPYTMSGTVAPPVLLGGNVIFGDIEPDTFCLRSSPGAAEVTISVNLFGHPGEEHGPHGATHVYSAGRTLWIEDAAQSILATRNGKRCWADITVFSGNIHKAVQCGEGGMCCTDDDDLADKMRMARNHGELAGCHVPGLNLRLTEVQAAIWQVQLEKAERIIETRIAIAEALTDAICDVGIPPAIKLGCKHSFYVWAMKCENRDWVARALAAEGVPVKAGYVTPLYLLPTFRKPIRRKIVEEVEDHIIIYENCTYDPSLHQLKQIREAFIKVAEHQERTRP